MFVDCWYISIEFFNVCYTFSKHLHLFNEGSSWNWMGLLPNFLAIYGEFDPNGRDLVTWHFYPNIKYPSPPIWTLEPWIDPSSGHLGEAFSLLPISESAVQPGHPGPVIDLWVSKFPKWGVLRLEWAPCYASDGMSLVEYRVIAQANGLSPDLLRLSKICIDLQNIPGQWLLWSLSLRCHGRCDRATACDEKTQRQLCQL